MTQTDPDIAPASLGATHEVFNQTPPLEDYNAFDCDFALKEGVIRAGGEWALAGLSTYGARIGSAEVTRWGFDAYEFRPKFSSHDRTGRRIDLVEYHTSYHALLGMALRAGLHSSPWTTPRRGAHAARAARIYLQAQVDAGHGCPLTMTFASVPALQATPSIAEAWLPKVLANDYDPRNVPYFEKTALTIGMGMTEKQGGSDVRANTTVAQPLGSDGAGEAYALIGHKWFTSAPMCDAFLVLAQTNAGLGCFLVPRWRPDGSKNPLEVQRLKNKMGNVSNASSEIELRGAFGWMLGEPGRGVPTIIEMVAMTRYDCMVGSSASQRQGIAQAVHHARHRRVFGKPLIEQPLMRNVLADLQLEVEGSVALSMRMAEALDAPGDEQQRLLLRIGLPVGKYWICKRAPNHAYECMECLGGNGVIEDFITARIYRDAPINAIWEGSGNVQALDALRAIGRTPEVIDAWLGEIGQARGASAALDHAVAHLKNQLADAGDVEQQGRALVDALALTMQASLLVRAGNAAVSDAFIASRIAAQGERTYGTLPRGVDVGAILARNRQSVRFD